MIPPLVPETDLEGLTLLHRGKVRDVYDAGDGHVLLVATDRVSAFDSVLRPAIPYKGAFLNRLSGWWFRRFQEAGVATHFVTDAIDEMPEAVRAHAATIDGRATLARRVDVVPVECVVRGYLAGSAYAVYRDGGAVCGVELPAGLERGDRLPASIFTPTTKASEGHDEPVTFAEVEAAHGAELAATLRDLALRCYALGAAAAEERGLLLVDTKFEIGRDADGNLLVCDEVLTPDSSRYWRKAEWAPGRPPQPMDKQLVRNHLLASGWDREPPPPPLPPAVVIATSQLYNELFEALTGAPLM